MTERTGFASAYLSADSIATTAALTFSPATHLVRALEQIDLRADHVVRKTTIEIEAPTERFLIPIAFPRRDQLIDTLRIETSDGVVPMTLGATATHSVMRALLRATAVTVDLPSIDENRLLDICRRVPTLERVRAIALVGSLREDLKRNVGGEPLTRDQSELLRALQLFCSRQPLLVPCVTTSNFLKLTFERDLSRNEIQWHGLRESVRFSFGRLPDDLLFDVSLANRARSYHFRLNAPAMNYVSKVECSRRIGADLASTIRVRKYEIEQFGPDRSLLRGVHPDSSGLCHVQINKAGQHRLARHGLLLRVQVREQPLGQMGGAFVRLLLTALTIAAVWRQAGRIVAFPTQSLSSIVLALPGLLGASFFVTRPLTGTRGPLVARVGSVTAAASAILLSVALAAWSTSAALFRAENPKTTVTYFAAPHTIDHFLEALFGVVSLLGLLCLSLLLYNTARFLIAQHLYKLSRRAIL